MSDSQQAQADHEPPPPGSDAARALNCLCPVLDNSHGRGYMGIEGVYIYSANCPVHARKRPPEAMSPAHGT